MASTNRTSMHRGDASSWKVLLREIVKGALEQVSVERSGYLTFGTLLPLAQADVFLAEHENTRSMHRSLTEYIGNEPLYTFCREALQLRLLESLEDELAFDKPVRLRSLAKFSDVHRTSCLLVDDLVSLPWTYTISYKLDAPVFQGMPCDSNEYKFYKNIRIIRPDQEYDTRMPLRTGRPIRDRALFCGRPLYRTHPDDPDTAFWQKNSWYLQLDLQGFIGVNSRGRHIDEALSTIQQFLGLFVALGAAVVDEIWTSIPNRYVGYLIVHKILDPPEIICTVCVPEALDALARHLVAPASSADKASHMIDRCMSDISCVFHKANKVESKKGINKSDRKAKQILLASELLVDSYLVANQAIAYLHAVVALEALLGNRDKSETLSTGQLLGNRCAYLLASSLNEREELLKAFNGMYKIRSSIVHGQTRTIAPDTSTSLYRLRDLCRRAIAKEIRLLVEDGSAEPRNKQGA